MGDAMHSIHEGVGLTIIVVGAGLAGLTCARLIQAAGQDVVVLEASDGVGGRVRSDQINGFTVDRGFQVLFEAYPAVQRQLKLPALELQAFDPGAIICRGNQRAVLTDPLRDRNPHDLANALTTAEIPLLDKFRTLRLVLALGWSDLDPQRLDQQSTEAYLRSQGFSATTIDRFFRPFYGGIFLERELATTAAAFAFYFQMLARGRTVLPAAGIGAIPAQIAAPLTAANAIRLHTRVTDLLRDGECVTGVRLAGGEELRGTVVLATDAPAAQQLAGFATPQGARQTVAIAFAGRRPVYSGKKIALNANPDAFVNNAQQLSNVVPDYAPPGQHLLTATILGDPSQEDRVLVKLAMQDLRRMWAGDDTAQAALATYYPLRVEHVRYAQFPQWPGMYGQLPNNRGVKDGGNSTPGLFVAAEWTESSSINGAITSGERCANLVFAASKETS